MSEQLSVHGYRLVTSHKVNGLNEALMIEAHEKRGPGNAPHTYVISDGDSEQLCYVPFQDGPLQESGLNGISNESLLAIVEDRLTCFQSSEFACRENAIALTKIQEAMMWLHRRTRDRIARGVEGTYKQ